MALANAYYATLTTALNEGGTETEVYVSTIKTLTGEILTTAQFATFGRGVLTVDPLVSSSIEFISFTAVDAVGLGFTGITRGLSALGNSVVAANKVYHGVGSQVIISFGEHNIDDILSYINSVVSGGIGTANDLAAGSTKITQNLGSLPRARAALVSQQATPNMTLLVNPFSITSGNNIVSFAGGNTPTFTAPVTHPRYDLVVYDTTNSVIANRTGTESTSPTIPTPNNGDIVLCSVYHIVGETTILERNTSPNTQGYIVTWYEPAKYLSGTNVTQNSVYDNPTDQSQTTENGTIAVGKANSTGNQNIVAERFIPTKTSIAGVNLYKIADTGTFTGTLTVSLQADSSGSPSGTSLATYTITNAVWLLINAGAFGVSFASEYESMSAGNPYWIVISTSTSDSSNHPNLGINTAGGYANGVLKYNNSTDGWVTVSTSILYFGTLEGVVSKVVETDTSGLIPFALRPYTLAALDATTYNSGSPGNTAYTVFSKTFPGGFFTANSGVKILTLFHIVAPSNGYFNVQVYINGTSVFTYTTTTNSQNANCYLQLYVVNTASLSAQTMYGHLNIGGTIIPNISTTSTVDTSQPVTLAITMNNTATSGTPSWNYYQTIVEKVG